MKSCGSVLPSGSLLIFHVGLAAGAGSPGCLFAKRSSVDGTSWHLFAKHPSMDKASCCLASVMAWSSWRLFVSVLSRCIRGWGAHCATCSYSSLTPVFCLGLTSRRVFCGFAAMRFGVRSFAVRVRRAHSDVFTTYWLALGSVA